MKCSLLALVFALTPLALLSTGCQEEPISCTLELRPSIVLDVVDAETGEEVEAMVAFQIDGGATQESERLGAKHNLGEEEDGTFVVTVSADGYETVMNEYVVTQDECHVTTVEATVELVPSA
jgi:hypothetical protein